MEVTARLYDLKLRKLAEQKKLSEDMNEICRKFNESSRKVCKNLEVAISVSKRPGYFNYYEPEIKIKEAEHNKTLANFSSSIRKVGQEIEQIDAEIVQMKTKREQQLHPNSSVQNLNDWFSAYGKPVNIDEKDKISKFLPSAKVYGGTSHHRAFRSGATIMKKGRVTI